MNTPKATITEATQEWGSRPFFGSEYNIRTYRLPDKADEFEFKPGYQYIVRDNIIVEFKSNELAIPITANQRSSYAKVAKRAARVLRPFPIWALGNESDLNIVYDESLNELWDGAAVITNKGWRKLLAMMNPEERKVARDYAKKTRRFEFTIMTNRGQEKGHAILRDDEYNADAHIIVPADTKPDVKLAIEGQLFVGLVPFINKNEAKLDEQSMIHFDVFDKGWLLNNFKRDLNNAFESVQSGKFEFMLSTLSEQSGWQLLEYVQSGMSLDWFGTMVKRAMRHVREQYVSEAGNMKLSLPGAVRYYLTSASVAGVRVKKGHVVFDKAIGVIVADEDYPAICERLGGADQDDGIVCMPIVMNKRTKRIMMWRSPNQAGEYWLAKLQGDYPVEGDVWYRVGELPPTIDQMDNEYLELVKSQPHHIKFGQHREALEAVLKNRGVLGAYVNFLMVHMAMHGEYPKTLPARLEDVIDGSVKDGSDLSGVMAWIKNAIPAAFKGMPIPDGLAQRVGMEPADVPNHWYQELRQGFDAALENFTKRAEALANTAIAPIEVYKAGANQLDHGRKIRALYRQGLQEPKYVEVNGEEIRVESDEPNFEAADKLVREYVSGLSDASDEGELSERQQALLATFAIAHMQSTQTRHDAAAFTHSVMGETIEALRVLDVHLKDAEDVRMTGVTIKYAWLNLALAQKKPALVNGKIDQKLAPVLKQNLANVVRKGSFIEKVFVVEKRFNEKKGKDEYLAFSKEKGSLLGIVDEDTPKTFTIEFAVAGNDGELHAVIR